MEFKSRQTHAGTGLTSARYEKYASTAGAAARAVQMKRNAAAKWRRLAPIAAVAVRAAHTLLVVARLVAAVHINWTKRGTVVSAVQRHARIRKAAAARLQTFAKTHLTIANIVALRSAGTNRANVSGVKRKRV